MKANSILALGLAVMCAHVLTQCQSSAPASVVAEGHRFIDLALPSGVMWAETNIGADTEADAGMYFAWGETKEKTTYDWSTYKYWSAPDSSTTKYAAASEPTTLLAADDAATCNWGDFCRMPTDAELAELRDTANCRWTWTTRRSSDGTEVNGYEVSSKRNGQKIFLPAGGYRDNNIVCRNLANGLYWSASAEPNDHTQARYIYFGPDETDSNATLRYYGYNVRAVLCKSKKVKE